MKITNKIKLYREENNYTQQNVADYCNISLRTYQRIENFERNGDIVVWQQLAKLYNTTIDDLLKQDDTELLKLGGENSSQIHNKKSVPQSVVVSK